MKKLYQNWIKDCGYHLPELGHCQCDVAVPMMIKVFPELIMKTGVVSSEDNIDNPSPKYLKEYPHAWCVDPEGNIVDPTVSQFILIGKLIYRELDNTKPVTKCVGCGSYFYGQGHGYCGECEFSE